MSGKNNYNLQWFENKILIDSDDNNKLLLKTQQKYILYK